MRIERIFYTVYLYYQGLVITLWAYPLWPYPLWAYPHWCFLRISRALAWRVLKKSVSPISLICCCRMASISMPN
jgi:hypothetical protein